MNASDYQRAAARTLISAPEKPFTADELQIMLGAINLVVKVGKVSDYVKKAVCHRHGFDKTVFQKLTDETSLAAFELAFPNEPTPELIFSGAEQMMLWCAIGLGGEAGEALESVSMLRSFDLFDRGDLSKELGDQQWYAAALCTLAGLDFGKVLAENIAKLARRYPNGYSSEDSKARRDTLEEVQL